MNNKGTIIFGLIALVVIVGGLWFYSNWQKYAPQVYVTDRPSEDGTSTVPTTVDTKTDTTSTVIPTFTMAEVATHKDATSCYTVISGSVYDVTLWVALHPGGKAAILSLCGTDGTARFTAKHSGDEKPNSTLPRFKIGVLAE